jgi:hypothetical protein
LLRSHAMPFDSIIPPSAPDLPAALRSHVRATLAGWAPRPTDPSDRPRPLAAVRALLRRPLSDKGQSLCY